MVPEGPSHPHCGTSPEALLSLKQRESPGLQSRQHHLWASAKLKFLLCIWGLGQYSLDFTHLWVFLSLLLGPLSLISGPFTYSDPAAGDV